MQSPLQHNDAAIGLDPLVQRRPLTQWDDDVYLRVFLTEVGTTHVAHRSAK